MAHIISIETIKLRGHAAARAGLPRDSHNMNWHAAALTHWLAAYDGYTANEPKCTRPVWVSVDLAQECTA